MAAPRNSKSDADLTMDELRLFISLRALQRGSADPESLMMLQNEVARLEASLTDTAAFEPFRLEQEDLDNLYLLRKRQALEPEGRVARHRVLRFVYRIGRRLFLGTQSRWNESATFLVRRLYATALLTRYYQLRSLALERKVAELEARLTCVESERAAPESDALTPGAGSCESTS